MLDNRSLLLGGIAGFSVALIGVGFFGCQKKDDKKKKGTTDVIAQVPGAQQSPEELNTHLATVDDVVITVGEFQERINRQSPYIRARYTSLEQKKRVPRQPDPVRDPRQRGRSSPGLRQESKKSSAP